MASSSGNKEHPIKGFFEIHSIGHADARGVFASAYKYADPTFQACWEGRSIKQVNFSRTTHAGTIRGLHLQRQPNCEAKLVRCLHGAVWDVVVDLRRSSQTFGHWEAVELSAKSGNAVLVPEGCAHGFQVLEPDSELLYIHSGDWVIEADTGIRFDDPDLAIPWPLAPRGLSERDLDLPRFESWR